MKNLYKIFYIFITCVLIVSCDSLVEEDNYQDDPNTVGSVPTINLISQVELTAMYLAESDASRYAAIGSNYIVGFQNQWIGYESYTFSPGDFDRLWTNIYVEGLRQARDGKIQAETENNIDATVTLSFFEALFLGELAATFNNVPDSEAIVDGITNPAYDSQEAVFNHVQELLNDVINLGNNSSLYITDASGGTFSTSTLGELAHSLKARYYLIAKDYPNALIQAQNGISSPNGDLVGTHTADSGAQNLWYNFTAISRPGDTTPKNGYLQELIRPGGAFTRILDTPGDAERNAFYFRGNQNYHNQAGGIFESSASLPIIGWNETQLILAEAASRTSQDGIALNALNAVRAELANEFGSSFPASTASGNGLLLHILEEKYITMYPSAQTWHDLVRTDNALNVPLKTGNQLVQRFIYPQSEVDGNTSVPSPLPGLFTPTNVNQ